ncbi:TonB-linked outer membrane protein, SusC/RagA family [Pustulibacterium marinum]|uniref:TonB-linked outer membrane protein, SusC/RagA family n=1 Tax=Pustulibacterium marinum TaxID=1224947 RepID=A0A1I7F2J0_9FLAO|nr:TonB-dependent receptor [Pustulibacterium marinum]SFU30377.1 TonB-linked outer membrane protein, SusC/RagA family [Pustulibacterium marinum]
MKSKILILIFGFMSLFTFAQEYDIEGVVYESSTGMPMPGVNVVLADNSKGTSTDFDGKFMLNGISKGSEIVFSYIGFQSKTITIQNGEALTINLEEDTNALEEVVVIGYGAQKKKEVTGAVATVGVETIENLDPVNVAQSLQGTTSGVNVTPTGGTPGAEANIRIRGVSTNGQNKPLIILDGFQYEGGLNSINPQDIETITVLKDAQAAIYGTIGANGVILVTTKKGRRDQAPKISYQGYTGIQETTRKLSLLNATEYALLLNESYANAGQTLPFSNVAGLGTGTNWQDEVFETTNVTSHNLSVSGGSEKISYSLSGSLLDQEGIIAPDKANFQRGTASITLDADITDKFRMSTKFFYNSTTSRGINSFSLGSVLFNAANIAPTIATDQYNLDGTINLGNEVVNPLAQIDNTYNKYITNRLSGTVQATLEYAKNLELQGRIGFNTSNTKNRDFSPSYYYGANKIYTNSISSVTLGKINDNDYTFDIFNTYQNTFADAHNVTFLLGMTVYETNGEGLYGSRTGVQANSWDFADLSSANGVGEEQTNSSYAYLLRRLSYFTRLQYNYKGKYLLSAMLRRDSSTRFGPNNRVAYFPSATAGWLISEEDFFNEEGFVSSLKLRGSYGVLGNDQIVDYGYVSLLNGEATYVLGADQSLVNGNALGTLANPDLQWEEAKKFDVGVDMSFWNDKMSVTADYFINNRDNLLISNIPVSGILGVGAPGAASPTKNAGAVRNAGLEFAINYAENISDDFSFSVGYNISTLKNEVTEVNGTEFVEGGAFGIGQLAPSRMEEGMPLGYFYGYVTDGIFQNQAEVDAHPSQQALGAAAHPGDIRFKDLNGDGIVNSDDRTMIGNPIPDVTMGFNLTINYKNFDFATYTYANLGNDIVRNFERDQPNVNKMSYWLDRWTGPGTSNTVPRVTTAATSNKVFSDFFVEDGSFARIQTMSLGYTIPKLFTEKVGIDKFRIYGKVDNVYTFTNYSGYDPTASTGAPIGGGIDLGFYPLPRTYMLGVNVEF